MRNGANHEGGTNNKEKQGSRGRKVRKKAPTRVPKTEKEGGKRLMERCFVQRNPKKKGNKVLSR